KNSAANAEWIADMQKANRPLTAFSQGGYLAAELFLKVVASIDGEVTRESVAKALHDMQPLTNPLAGSPYVFGKAKTHSPMQATKVMKLEAGAWKV
ncbi:branched-chain amino acid ABC transporter substrate-binding protein, partial [Mesorhizobium sp. M4B.F.Ca.ET.172.01.1.1]